MIAASPLSLPARLAPLPLPARGVRRRVLHDYRADHDGEAVGQAWGARRHRTCEDAIISADLAAFVKGVRFGAYERLCSLRRPLCVPLLIVLLLTGVLHVVAVHLYR